MKDISIYIHIPFCASKCFYCDFNSYANKEDLIDLYVDALIKEILSKSDILSEYNIKTIYFGGGTPSFIDSKYIVKIMNVLNMFNVDKDAEITIEINPNSITYEKLEDYKLSGINRISIGLQTTFDDVLKNIGRRHTLNDFISALELIKKVGILNISCDLIYPLPDLSYERFKESIDYVILLSKKYDIKHISIYNLEVHEGSKLDFLLKEGFLKLVDEDEEYKMRKYLISTLENNNFIKYEISNFSIPGYESKHNLNYWNQGVYLGFGAGASSFISSSRYRNVNSIEKYINGVNSNNLVIEDREDMDSFDLIKEYIILRLRLKEGIIVKDFKTKFNETIFKYFSKELDELSKNNLIIITDSKIYLSDRGQEVANQVWEKFI